MNGDESPNPLEDQVEHFLDSLLERRVLGTAGPRYRSIALVVALLVGGFNAYRCSMREPMISNPLAVAAPAATSSDPSQAGLPTPAPTAAAFNVPGMR